MSLPEGDITAADIEQLVAEFHRMHQELYTFSMPWVPVEIRNLRLIAKSKGQKIKMGTIEAGGAGRFRCDETEEKLLLQRQLQGDEHLRRREIEGRECDLRPRGHRAPADHDGSA